MIDDSNFSDHYFQSRFCYNRKRADVWKVICSHLQLYVPLDGRVLDVGAGYCDFINHIQTGEKHALNLYSDFTQYAAQGVQTHVGSCADLAVFHDNYFDVVFESNVLEHLTRPMIDSTLAEVRRVLKPGGCFIAIQPNFRYCYRSYFDDYTHLQVFTHVSLADLLVSTGFDLIRVEPRFLPTTFKSRLPAWPWLVAIYLTTPALPPYGWTSANRQPFKTALR
jgi:SAM-dependent methyltransferase